jgi:hypothetical protein
MKPLKINQSRYDKLCHDYPKIMEKLMSAVNEAKAFLWDFKMLIESDKEEKEKDREYNS